MSKGRKCFLVAVSSIATTAAAVAAAAACVQKRTLPACCTRHTASARKFSDVLSSCYELSLSSVEAKELSSVAVSQKCSHRSIAEQFSPS